MSAMFWQYLLFFYQELYTYLEGIYTNLVSNIVLVEQ